jgi:2-C-methyl-D-erythritol 4-phosphate cytidylyltransferase
MVEWSIDAFRACDSVRSIVVAVPPGAAHRPGGDDLRVIDGGATRSQSVANALATVGTRLVAIHDAARPLLTPRLVQDLVAHLDADPDAGGVIAATPVTDTIKHARERQSWTRSAFDTEGVSNAPLEIDRTLDRSRLWAAQTPQLFRADVLRAALQVDAGTRDAATDEATLVEAAGGTVLIHPTSDPNPKVTTPLDLRLAELLLTGRA